MSRRRSTDIPSPITQLGKLFDYLRTSPRSHPDHQITRSPDHVLSINQYPSPSRPIKIARRRYRQFVKKGIDQGKRSDLQGGGLVRSAGGERIGLLGRKEEDRELSDQRILGSGDFVAQVLEEANELEERRIKNKISLEELLQKVSADMEIELKELMSPSRRTKISMARAIVSYWAVREMGYPGIEIGRILNLSGPGVTKCVARGKKILDNNEKLRYKLLN